MIRPVVAIYERKGINLVKEDSMDYKIETCKKMASTDLGLEEEQIDFLVYQDLKSGQLSEREGLQQLFRDIPKKGIKFIYTNKLSSLTRNSADLLNIYAEVEKSGVELVCVNENFRTSNPSTKLIWSIIAVVGDIERENRLMKSK